MMMLGIPIPPRIPPAWLLVAAMACAALAYLVLGALDGPVVQP